MNTPIVSFFTAVALSFSMPSAFAQEQTLGGAEAGSPKVNIIGKCWQRDTKPKVNKCLENSLARLDHQVRQRLVVLNQQAVDLESISEGAKGLVLALESAKSEFGEFRQALCHWEGLMMAGGSGSASQYLSCEIELTQHWLSRLHQW
ncbi:lysozyme inhibitor LprI family protein [Agarivorans sp. DSG3-1]|uniref:lysozyme inhibitor LprI family protein n=1 Tax=Agarivorans sp. DSG3-1 TaxID=3342249 RepID=UPI00398EEC3E